MAMLLTHKRRKIIDRMNIDYPPSIKMRPNLLLVGLALLTLSACNPREDELAAREASISARESELVTLLAEMVEQKKSLDKLQADKTLNSKENEHSYNTQPNPCNPNNVDTSKNAQSTLAGTRTILGGVENVYLNPPGLEFTARIDTGAQTSSLNALDIVEFERDGKPFVKFKIIHPQTGEKIELTRRLRRHALVKERNNRESQRRPVVRMRVELANINEHINFTLVDRGRHKHQVLIGRNLLRDLAIVDVSKKFTTVKTDNPENGTKK